jgi:hypothetical protein
MFITTRFDVSILLVCGEVFFWDLSTRSSGMRRRVLLVCGDAFFWKMETRSSGMLRRILLGCIEAFLWDWRRVLLECGDEFFWEVSTRSSGMWRHCTASHKNRDLNPAAAKAFGTRKSRSAVVLVANFRLDPEQKHSMQVPQQFVIGFVTTLPS